MLYLRLTSSYLPDTDYSDYLVDQLQDISDVCLTVIPDITVRALPTYPSGPRASSINFGTATTTTTATSITSPICTGQTIGVSQNRAPQVHGRSVEVRQDSSTCDTLSSKYGVTTGDLQAIIQSNVCAISSSICLPAACSLQQVPTGATW